MTQLLAVHNVFEDKLHFSHKLGGLACPSLAIIRSDLPYTKYGPITLVADKELIDPSVNNVFNSDVYSPRFPNVFYKANNDKLKVALSAFESACKAINETISIHSIDDNIQRKGTKGFIESLRDEIAVKIAFVQHKGIKLEIPMKAPDVYQEISKDIRVQNWCKKNSLSKMGWDDPKHLELGEIARKIYEEESQEEAKGIAEKRNDDEDYQEVYDDMFDFIYGAKISALRATPNGFTLTVAAACELENDLLKLSKETQVIDRYAFDDKYNEFFSKYQNEFESWLFNLAKDVPESPWFYDDNNNKTELTIDNVVKEMSRSVRDGELGSYGIGQVRALVSQKFNSLEDIDNHASQIANDEEFEEEREHISDMFGEVVDSLRPHYRFQSDRPGFQDEVIASLKEYIEKGDSGIAEYYYDFPGETKQLVDEFLTYLETAKTTYFEAKFTRAVTLDEFKMAIVPNNLSQDSLNILKEHDLEVIQYKYQDKESRLRAIKKAGDLAFGKIDKINNSVPVVDSDLTY